jgi:hypothetical protein
MAPAISGELAAPSGTPADRSRVGWWTGPFPMVGALVCAGAPTTWLAWQQHRREQAIANVRASALLTP